MQTHAAQLAKQRLSDFFVKEDGHVAHKNALIAGTVATGAILESILLTPDAAEAHWDPKQCGNIECNHDQLCCSSRDRHNHVFYYCAEGSC